MQNEDQDSVTGFSYCYLRLSFVPNTSQRIEEVKKSQNNIRQKETEKNEENRRYEVRQRVKKTVSDHLMMAKIT